MKGHRRVNKSSGIRPNYSQRTFWPFLTLWKPIRPPLAFDKSDNPRLTPLSTRNWAHEQMWPNNEPVLHSIKHTPELVEPISE